MTTGVRFVRRYSLPLAASLALMLAPLAALRAQTTATTPGPVGPPTPAPNQRINRTELNNFDHFLDSHPWDQKALAKDPSLINNPQYLQNHPHLQTFLNNHPGVREQVQANPNRFINREKQFERRGGDISRGELGRFDNQYLDKHPKVARQLNRNPRLVDNPEFLEKHPHLATYLKNHPEIREDFRQHPYAFRNRERQYEHHENREPRPTPKR